MRYRHALQALLFAICSSVAIIGGAHGISISERLDGHAAHLDSGRVMVLGSPHLAQVYEAGEFDPGWLDGLIDALENFGPDMITIEMIPPRAIHATNELGVFRNFHDPAEAWRELVNQHLAGLVEVATSVREESGLSWAEARTRQHELFGHAASGSLEPAKRRELAAMSMAAYDPYTALLHWDGLPGEERIASDGISDAAIEYLDARVDSPNETVSIGIRLANRIGLHRLDPVDAQIAQSVQRLEEFQRFEQVMEESGLREELTATFEEARAPLLEAVETDNDLLALYQWYNSPDYSRLDLDTQWGAYVSERMDTDLAGKRIARREARDLTIAANIREVHARNPGADVLVIIGASHKAFLESYLSDLTRLELVQLKDFIEPNGD